MSELVCLELSVLLWIVHVLCQALTARAEFGDMYLFGPRRTAEELRRDLAAAKRYRVG